MGMFKTFEGIEAWQQARAPLPVRARTQTGKKQSPSNRLG
jgi:hypothetical protein